MPDRQLPPTHAAVRALQRAAEDLEALAYDRESKIDPAFALARVRQALREVCPEALTPA